MLTHDQVIDRRILLEAESLENAGWTVTVIAHQLDSANTTDTASHPRLIRVKTSATRTPRFFATLLKLHQRTKKTFMRYPALYAGIRGLLLRFVFPPDRIFKQLFLTTALQYDADIYMAHDLPLLPVAAECARRKHAKLVYDSHELFPYQDHSIQETNVWKKIEARAIRHCDLVMTINPAIADLLQTAYHLQVVQVLQNAVKVPTTPLNRQRIFHRTFQLSETSQIVLYQGKLSIKHHHLRALMEAMNDVTQQNIHLVLMGQGDSQDVAALKAFKQQLAAGTRIHFHPAVAQNELLTYTACADVGIIPYQATCLNNRYCTPNKLYEFIAAGLPIIATDLSEITRIIQHYDIGLVGCTETPKAIALLIDACFAKATVLAQWQAQVQRARAVMNWATEEQKLVAWFQPLSAHSA